MRFIYLFIFYIMWRQSTWQRICQFTCNRICNLICQFICCLNCKLSGAIDYWVLGIVALACACGEWDKSFLWSPSRALSTFCLVVLNCIRISSVEHLNGIFHRLVFALFSRKKYSAISVDEHGSYSFSNQNRLSNSYIFITHIIDYTLNPFFGLLRTVLCIEASISS